VTDWLPAVNAHTHLYSGLAPLGMPAPANAPESFLEILERVWWRLDRALDEASLRASARLYIAEALLAGTTTIIDHHESPSFIEGSLDVLAEEATRLGARLLVTYGATERNGGRDEARRGLAECARFIREARFPLVKGVVGLHASFTVSDETIREAGVLARELGVPIHVHVAEDKADVADAVRRGYRGPVERLIALDALPPDSILAHGVWLDEASVRLTVERGAWIVQNPRSNANNRVGYPRALHASTRVALGTDGFPADMLAENRALGEAARANGDPAGPGRMGGRGGAGWAVARAFFPDVLSDQAVGEPPTEVVVARQPVVQGGRLVHDDIDAIRAHAREQAARLWSRMEALP
jgi:cytosine/adenosine deaminase-related metal-dependent hydrolase